MDEQEKLLIFVIHKKKKMHQSSNLFQTIAGENYTQYCQRVSSSPKGEGIWISRSSGFSIGTNRGANSYNETPPESWVYIKSSKSIATGGCNVSGDLYEVPDGIHTTNVVHDVPTSQYSSEIKKYEKIYHVLNGHQIYNREEQAYISMFLYFQDKVKIQDEIEGVGDEGVKVRMSFRTEMLEKGEISRIYTYPDGFVYKKTWVANGYSGGEFGNASLAEGLLDGTYPPFTSMICSDYATKQYMKHLGIKNPFN